MKRLSILLFLTLSAHVSQIGAQTTASAPQPSKEQVEQYVKDMESYISGRQTRAAALVNQIVELDTSLKGSVTSVLEKLKAITDSQDSKTKVSRIKRDVIQRIENAARYYAQERAKVEESLRVSTNAFQKEDLYKERAQFDARIDAMVKSVVELAVSMDSHQDYEKYLYEGGDNLWGWDENIRKNPEYEQNKRTTRQTGVAVKEINTTLQQSLDRLKSKQTELERQLAAPNLGGEQKKSLQGELDRINTIRQQRIDQMYALGTPDTMPTVPVGLRDAMQVEDVIEVVAADAKRDMSNLFARYRELRAERDAIASHRVRLARAQQWLEEQGKK